MTVATCPTVIVDSPAAITATAITATPSITPCVAGTCTVAVSVTWKNNGTLSGSAVLNITIDGVAAAPVPVATVIAGGASVTKTFTVSGLSGGTGSLAHTICPSPN